MRNDFLVLTIVELISLLIDKIYYVAINICSQEFLQENDVPK